MNIVVFWGLWIFCGCIMSALIYLTDSDKEIRSVLYCTNFYILFMVIFWPVVAYFFFRLVLVALLSKRKKEGE